MHQQSSAKTIKGPDFNTQGPLSMKDFLDFYNAKTNTSMGGQTSNMEKAIELLNEVLSLRGTDSGKEPTIFLAITSNVISCGLRETVAFLCQHKLVDAVICTGGGIEEDFMKTQHPSYVVEYQVNDRRWRVQGKNRIGNMVVPVTSYEAFDDYLDPLLDTINKEICDFENKGAIDENFRYPTPSSLIRRLGEQLMASGDFPESFNYWCTKNKIPIFCPAITDSAIGDNVYYSGFRKPKMTIDVNADINSLFDIACNSKGPLAAVILGGGMVKYHVLNACKVAGGLDYGVFITVGEDWDGSYTGADPEEDVSRKAIKPTAKIVVLKSEFSLTFPVIVANTFVKHHFTSTKAAEPKEGEAAEKKDPKD